MNVAESKSTVNITLPFNHTRRKLRQLCTFHYTNRLCEQMAHFFSSSVCFFVVVLASNSFHAKSNIDKIADYKLYAFWWCYHKVSPLLHLCLCIVIAFCKHPNDLFTASMSTSMFEAHARLEKLYEWWVRVAWCGTYTESRASMKIAWLNTSQHSISIFQKYFKMPPSGSELFKDDRGKSWFMPGGDPMPLLLHHLAFHLLVDKS